jgi:hypothetical protein
MTAIGAWSIPAVNFAGAEPSNELHSITASRATAPLPPQVEGTQRGRSQRSTPIHRGSNRMPTSSANHSDERVQSRLQQHSAKHTGDAKNVTWPRASRRPKRKTKRTNTLRQNMRMVLSHLPAHGMKHSTVAHRQNTIMESVTHSLCGCLGVLRLSVSVCSCFCVFLCFCVSVSLCLCLFDLVSACLCVFVCAVSVSVCSVAVSVFSSASCLCFLLACTWLDAGLCLPLGVFSCVPLSSVSVSGVHFAALAEKRTAGDSFP